MNKMEAIKVQLPDEIDYANLSSTDVEALVERVRYDLKRKELIAKHKEQIKQLPSGRYYTRINGKKIERKNIEDIEDAIVKYYRKDDITLASIFDNYLERRKMTVSPTTWSKDVRYYNTFIKPSEVGNKALKKLDLDDGYNFLKECLQIMPNMKQKYWHNLIGFINQMFQYAMDKNYIKKNPFINMKPRKDLFEAPTLTRDGDTVFSKAEQTKVCALAEEDAQLTQCAIPLGIVLLFNLGLRDGELCAMKWRDIETNSTKTYIHIQREMVAHITEEGKMNGFEILPHCKTPAGDRRLQLNDKAIQLFEQIKAFNEAEGLPTGMDDCIFLRWAKSKVQHCTPRSFDPRLRKYCRKAEMEVIKSPHDIRRTVLTNLYSVGMPLKKIQEYAGHSSLKQTMDYIRVSDDDYDISQFLNTLSEGDDSNIISFSKEARLREVVN